MYRDISLNLSFYLHRFITEWVETIKIFISLRGESIRKQLTGEIPSTTEEQDTTTPIGRFS